MVCSYLLTPRERRTLQRYVATGEALNSFSGLLKYLQDSKEQLRADMNLIDAVLKQNCARTSSPLESSIPAPKNHS